MSLQPTLPHHTVHKLYSKSQGRLTNIHKRSENVKEERKEKTLLRLGVRLGDPHSQTYTHGVVRK